MDEDNIGYIGLALLIIVVVFMIWPINKEITIDSRHWEYEVVVGHYETTTTYETVMECNSENVCTSSLERKTSTDWVTSCHKTNSGTTLPIVRPVPNCIDREEKDYIRYITDYHLTDSNKYDDSQVSKSQWLKLNPNSIAEVKGNRLGKIYTIEAILR